MDKLIELPLSQIPVVILVIAALFFWARTVQCPLLFRPAILAAFIFLANYSVLVLGAWLSSVLPILAIVHWNWLGKILSLACSFAFIMFSSQLTLRKVVGTFRPTDDFSWVPIALVASAIVLIGGSVGFLDHHGANANLETLLYQATLPGLAEELLYRGILLSLLMDSLGGHLELNANWLVPGLCASLMFGSVHGVSFDNHGFHLDLFYLLFTALMGILLVWLRLRTKALILPIIAHNSINFLDYSDVFIWRIVLRAVGG